MADEDLVDQLLADQTQQCNQFGVFPPVEEYLAAYPALQHDSDAQATLALNEYALRQHQRQPPARSVFLSRFPAIAADLAIMMEINDGLESLDERVTAPTYLSDPGDTLVEYPILQRRLPGFEILRTLGEGAMGIVYLAHQVHLHRKVALKLLRSAVAAGREEHGRLRSEADALANLQHPNIVGIYDFGEAEGQPYLVLEYVDGESLAVWWRHQQKSPRLAAMVIERLARAMHVAHGQGIVHRDLKPGNVLMAGNGNEPKITDFGLAKYFRMDAGQTNAGAILGTPDYMAPEQATGRIREIGPHTDIYALGAILYEMLAGTPPIRRDSIPETLAAIPIVEPKPPSQIANGIPKDVETICLKCLRKDAHDRYKDAQSLADDLRSFLDNRPIQARRASRLERARMWVQRNPSVSVLSAAVMMLFLGGFGMVTWKWLEANFHRESAEQNANNLALSLAKEKGLNDTIEVVSYFDKIALADREFQANNVLRAAEVLRQCPKGLRGWEWRYLQRLCDGAAVVCGENSNPVVGAAFSPDGQHLAAWGHGILAIYDPATGRARWHESSLGIGTVTGGCAWNPVEPQFAVGCEKGLVQIRNAITGKVERAFQAHDAAIRCLAFSPDGRLLASGGNDRSVRVWDSAGKCVHHFGTHQGTINSLAFHPRKPYLVSASNDELAKIWDLETDTEVAIFCGHGLPVQGVAFHPSGQYLITGSSMKDPRMVAQGSIMVWNFETGEILRTLTPNSGTVEALAISADGRQMAAAFSLGMVRRWEWQDYKELSPIRLAGAVSAVSFGGSARLATVDQSGLIKVWNTTDAQEPRNLRISGTSSVTALAVHPFKKQLAFGDGSGRVQLMDIETGTTAQWPVPSGYSVWSLAYSPDGKYLAAGRHDHLVQLGRTDGSDPAILRGHQDRVYSVAFSPNSKQLISGSSDHTLKIWNPETGTELCTLNGHRDGVRSVASDQQGKRIASISIDRTVRIWDQDSYQELQCWPVHNAVGAACVAFHPDGKTFATGGEGTDPSIRFRNAVTGAEIAIGQGHWRKVASVAFSPDGRRLVSTSDDNTVRIWEPSTGRLVITLNGHRAGTTAATFTPDGSSVISASWDGTIRLWDATP